jgi:hypothetical protein
MIDPSIDAPAVTAELVHADELGIDRLQRRPIIDRINSRQLALIKATLAISESEQHPITDAEIGHFLELCALYGLDPFAREAWIAKSKTGKLLIMVGRMGLRKIVQRAHLKMRSATVYAKDAYAVEYIDNPADAKEGEWEAHGRAPFHRVEHKQCGIGEARGVVVGAWARVSDPKTGREAGWFDAPLSEYMPANASPYSPWSKQTSAMMRGAVERQAATEATTLGGFVMEGEDESANARETVGYGPGSGEGPGWGDMEPDLIERIQGVIARAKALGHGGYSDEPTIQQRLHGQPPERVHAWIVDALGALDEMEMTDADVAEPLTLTFGGETFTFSDDGEPYRSIDAALGEGKEAMIATARDLEVGAHQMDKQRPDLEDAGAWVRSMAAALMREATG